MLREGGREDTSWHTSIRRPLDPDMAEDAGFWSWWERVGFVAQGLVTSICRKIKVLAALSGPQGFWRLAGLGLGKRLLL